MPPKGPPRIAQSSPCALWFQSVFRRHHATPAPKLALSTPCSCLGIDSTTTIVPAPRAPRLPGSGGASCCSVIYIYITKIYIYIILDIPWLQLASKKAPAKMGSRGLPPSRHPGQGAAAPQTPRRGAPPTTKCHSVAMLARSSVPWRLGPACRVGGLCSSTSTGLLACR